MFVDPEPEQVEASHALGADKIEIHTGAYANARTEDEQHDLLILIREAAVMAKEMGLGVNAGHGLNYVNVEGIRAISEIDEVSIGHAILSRAILVGLDRAVRDMLMLVKK